MRVCPQEIAWNSADKAACGVSAMCSYAFEMGFIQNYLTFFCQLTHLKRPQLRIMALSSHRIFTPSSEPEWSVHDEMQVT